MGGTLRTRYRDAGGDLRRYTALADDDDTIRLSNDARFNRRDEIIAAYRAGRPPSELVTEWGVSERTILRWVGRFDG